MKWSKRNIDAGYLGSGYESGDYIIKETHNSYNLQKEKGGKRSDYYWVLMKGDEVLKYASTAKALKAYAEILSEYTFEDEEDALISALETYGCYLFVPVTE